MAGAGDGRIETPFGAWPSPFAIELLTKGSQDVQNPAPPPTSCRACGAGGGQVLVRQEPDGSETPDGGGLNTRSRVHEYGGGAYVLDGDVVIVSDFATGRLNRVTAPGPPSH
jgi:hypothetical protein